MRLQFALLAFSLAGLPSIRAWGGAGHEMVATIAQLHLHPDVLPILCDILGPPEKSANLEDDLPCHLSSVASWADTVKRRPEYRYTSVMHYVNARDDHPPDACAFPGENGWMGRGGAHILGAIQNVTNVLGTYVDLIRDDGAPLRQQGETAGSEALKFLIHYMGDLHQPLHLIGRERGGNGVKVTFDGRMMSQFSFLFINTSQN